jgi:secreted PhoX family phosphatase
LIQRTREQVLQEQEQVGGSLLRLKRQADGRWTVVPNDPLNRRISGLTPIPFASERRIAGEAEAIGTMGNCAGGQTPWGTFLTCEENTDEYYGVALYSNDGLRRVEALPPRESYGWQKYFGRPPEHYGWVVEVEPLTGAAKKLTALGRFAHEGATVVTARDGRQVVYMGDDETDQCIYKFVSDRAGSLEKGILYVADVTRGRWLPLDRRLNSSLRTAFHDQTELLIRTRDAAKMVGGTPMDRPEAIAIDPKRGDVYVSLTNNKPKGNYHGSLFKIMEKGGDYLAEEFRSETFLMGGTQNGFSCPDNIKFDPAGHLWMTCDVSGSAIGKAPYEAFGNNALFVIPMSGPQAGTPLRIASAPNDAEFTGPCFSPDGQTLFLSVQHPGEMSQAPRTYTSSWPDGGKPRSAVVAIRGAFPS